jgi:transposase
LRVGKTGEPVEALSRGGRYIAYDEGREMKEVKIGEEGAANYRRYVVVKNPEMARRDKINRDDIVVEVERRLAKLKALEGDAHHKAECELRAHKTYGRFVTQTPKGRLSVNRDKIAQEERCDGKFMVSSSDHSMSAEEIMYGYKALCAIERTFHDMKHVLDLRPVCHRVSDRIRAHVLLYWLAVVLVRVAESATGETWSALRLDMGRQLLGTFQCKQGELQHVSRPSPSQMAAFNACHVAPPPKIYALPASRKA